MATRVPRLDLVAARLIVVAAAVMGCSTRAPPGTEHNDGAADVAGPTVDLAAERETPDAPNDLLAAEVEIVSTCYPRENAGTPCGVQSCDSGVAVARVCDGQGRCQALSILCAPLGCDSAGHGCAQTCTVDADCGTGVVCVRGSCGHQGAVFCEADADCLSGHCADNVCCDTACDGLCLTCDSPSQRGICAPFPSGSVEPDGRCAAEDPATCGRTGFCANAACALYPSDRTCGLPTCANGTLTMKRVCDGLGTCLPGGTLTCQGGCDPGGGACTTCPDGDSICAPGAYCAGDDVCVLKKPPGQLCGSDHECTTGHCRPDGDAGPVVCVP